MVEHYAEARVAWPEEAGDVNCNASIYSRLGVS